MFRNSKPEDVFTPRSAEVNEDMYVDRSELEERLIELVTGSKHFVVHGESGNGKSWLYKRVFEKNKIPYLTVNLANASRHGSIQNAFTEKLNRASGTEEQLKEIVTNRDLSFMPEGVGAAWTKQRVLEVIKTDPVEAIMGWLRANSGRKKAIIVLDNFETIVSKPELISELSDILILLDDDDYAKYDIKFCIVGVPADLRSYLTAQGSPWIQVASATPGLKASISSAIASAGVLQPRVFLGRLFSSAATSFSHV